MLSILLFSSLIISSFTVTPTKAIDYTKVGVKVGDWAYYSVTDNLTTAPMSFNINFTITNIVQSNVTANLAFYYTNGTLVTSQTQWGNLSNGNYGTQGPGRFDVLWFLVVPNLTTGDMIFINGPSVNNTGIMVAGGLARPYAYLNLTVDGNSTAFRWDQTTGIGVQGNLLVGSGATTHFYLNWILNSTSLWSPPSYKVGVKVGDTAYYSLQTNATGMTGFTNANLTITKIDRGNVTATFVWYNSTKQHVVTPYGNVSSGQGSSFPFPFVLIAANMTNADPIWLNNNFAWINETSTAVFGGLARALVQINTTATSIPGYLYWDRLTGIAVDLNITLGGAQYIWSLISTSLWSPPNYSKVGVKVGDWAYYSTNITQPGMTGMRNANFTITKVDRGNVTITIAQYFKNGTMSTQILWGNVSNGESNTIFAFFLIAANLSKDDPLFYSAPLWINDTTSMTIFGESRICNQLIIQGDYFYWDQATGITTKASFTGLGSWNMTSTSLWSPAPTIDQPSAVSYVVGSTGHSITWHPSSNVPCNYTITRDGLAIIVVAMANWNGSSITCNVDGLGVGSCNYTCTVNDTIGRTATSTVMVTVTAAPPVSGLPISVILVVGGIAVVVIVVVAVVVLRRRRT
jgi:hypothetical protein